MDRATFFKHFDLLADQPDAVAKMRELVLQLAVHGKVVSQNPKDESAEKLIVKVRAAKERLTKELRIKELAAELPIKDEDRNRAIPQGWAWVKLADICIKLGAGSTPLGGKQIYERSGVKFLRSQNVYNDGLRLDDVAFIPPAVHQDMSGTWVQPGDILLNITGASIGRSAIVPDDFDEANVSQHVAIVRLAEKELRQFLHLVVIAPDFQQRIMDVQVGVSREGLSMTRLKEFVVAVPPLAEQRRIVAKVDELMTLCDELAVRQQAQHDAATQFQRSALHHLVAARDQATFATGLHRVSDHFHWLHDSPDSIAQLRQTILQLAVQGRLGTQDRKDEPAKKLIEQARAQWPDRKVSERQNWKPEEPPCELPAGWEWTCLDVLGNTNPRNEADEKMEVAFTPMKFISAEFGRPAAFEIRPWGEVKKGFTHFANNDVVLAKITPCFENGKSAVMRGLKNGIGAGTTELHVFRRYDECVLPDYVLLFFKTSHFIETGVPRMTGSAGQKRVSWEYFANSPFPLPPLAEQKRIVTMVNDLTQQCDALELQLNDSRTLGTQLLDSTIHHLFVKPEESELAASSGGRKK